MFVYRQCLCCFKEYKHLEVFSQLVYALINLVIAQVTNLRDRLRSGHGNTRTEGAESEWGSAQPQPSPSEDEPLNVERDSAEEDGGVEDGDQHKNQNQGVKPDPQPKLSEPTVGGESGNEGSLDPFASWSTEDQEKLLLCAAKIFQIQFPLYTAYKHNTHPTIEVIHTRVGDSLDSRTCFEAFNFMLTLNKNVMKSDPNEPALI